MYGLEAFYRESLIKTRKRSVCPAESAPKSPAKPKAPDTAEPGAATEQPGGRALLLRGVTLWTTLSTPPRPAVKRP